MSNWIPFSWVLPKYYVFLSKMEKCFSFLLTHSNPHHLIGLCKGEFCTYRLFFLASLIEFYVQINKYLCTILRKLIITKNHFIFPFPRSFVHAYMFQSCAIVEGSQSSHTIMMWIYFTQLHWNCCEYILLYQICFPSDLEDGLVV